MGVAIGIEPISFTIRGDCFTFTTKQLYPCSQLLPTFSQNCFDLLHTRCLEHLDRIRTCVEDYLNRILSPVFLNCCCMLTNQDTVLPVRDSRFRSWDLCVMSATRFHCAKSRLFRAPLSCPELNRSRQRGHHRLDSGKYFN
jgi:hypothetical protein